MKYHIVSPGFFIVYLRAPGGFELIERDHRVRHCCSEAEQFLPLEVQFFFFFGRLEQGVLGFRVLLLIDETVRIYTSMVYGLQNRIIFPHPHRNALTETRFSPKHAILPNSSLSLLENNFQCYVVLNLIFLELGLLLNVFQEFKSN